MLTLFKYGCNLFLFPSSGDSVLNTLILLNHQLHSDYVAIYHLSTRPFLAINMLLVCQ